MEAVQDVQAWEVCFLHPWEYLGWLILPQLLPTSSRLPHGIVAAIPAAYTVGISVTGTSTLYPLKSLCFYKIYGTISDLEIPGV